MVRLKGLLRWQVILPLALVVVLFGGGTTAAVCKFAADCGIRSDEFQIDEVSGVGGGEIRLPDDLSVSTFASGLEFPTDFDFLPDGRVVVSQKDGLLRLVDRGATQGKPFLDLRARVNRWYFRGVLDVTVDPAFPRRPFIYVVYTARGAGRDSAKATVVRVSRFRVRGDQGLLASEQVLLGRDRGRTCPMSDPTRDCIPADGDVAGADIAFAPDGSLFVGTGDGGGTGAADERPLTAQDPDSLGGKILHIDRNGLGLRGNPYWNGDATANRSKVWALGFRNPFRFVLVQRPRVALLVADVGAERFDEIDLVYRGANHGWPCKEGPEPMMSFKADRRCLRGSGSSTFVDPWVPLPHPDYGSVTGGVLIADADGWPSAYARSYVFGDWRTSELHAIRLSVDGRAEAPRLLTANAGGPVAFRLGPDDALYYLALNVGELRRISPT